MFSDLLKERTAGARVLNCPEFPLGTDWLQSPALSFRRELRGKLTLLFFWNGHCVHSEHALAWLRELSQKIDDPRLAIIAVHLPLRYGEDRGPRLESLLERLDIPYPVLNDLGAAYSASLNVYQVPVIACVGPGGSVLQAFWGEEWRYSLYSFVMEALSFFPDEVWDRHPLKSSPLCSLPCRADALRFPSQLVVDYQRHCYWVADTGNSRVLAVGLDGQCGTAYQFQAPSGLYLQGSSLYVTDKAAHSVYAVDLASGQRQLLWGLGECGADYLGGQSRRFQLLSSPSAMVGDGSCYWLAMEGSHQLWAFTDEDCSCIAVSGTGRQSAINAWQPATVSWALPQVLCLLGPRLFVGEGRGDHLRYLHIKEGYSASLQCRFQNVTGLCGEGLIDQLLLSDAAQQRVYLVDFTTQQAEALEDQVGLIEPMGICPSLEPGRYTVVDRGLHRILSIDPIARTIYDGSSSQR